MLRSQLESEVLEVSGSDDEDGKMDEGKLGRFAWL